MSHTPYEHLSYSFPSEGGGLILLRENFYRFEGIAEFMKAYREPREP